MIKIEELLLKLACAPGDVYRAAAGWIGVKRVPNVGPDAYLHVLFPPVDAAVSAPLVLKSGLVFPACVENFLKSLNGAILFQGKLSLYGIRTTFVRDVMNRQPFDIIEVNTIARPYEARPGDFYIGSCSADGSRLLVRAEEPVVYRCERGSQHVLQAWGSIDEMLSEEIQRLVAEYEQP